MLRVEGLNIYYGGIHALRSVDIEVNEGEVVTIIGSNGAGKSTLLNSVSGFLKPREGVISYRNTNITGEAPHKIVKLGLCHIPEGRLVFVNLTVKDNLKLGAYLRTDKKAIAASGTGFK